MPYIITTRPASHGPWEGPEYYESPFAWISRTAVATLDEARELVTDTLSDDFQCPLSADGGTVGPLSDGTVIEVRHVDWIAMRTMAGRLPVRTHDKPAVLAAFNAR